MGEAKGGRMTRSERERVAELIAAAEQAILSSRRSDLKHAAIDEKLGWKDGNTRKMLHGLCKENRVKSTHGSYRLKDPS
jgi:hypothetical protein